MKCISTSQSIIYVSSENELHDLYNAMISDGFAVAMFIVKCLLVNEMKRLKNSEMVNTAL
jgi:hypothetical protein